MMHNVNNRFFLTIHDRICCLLASSILLPMSLFIVATTIRQISSISGTTEDIYVISTKSSSAIICVVTSVFSIFVSVVCPYRRISFTNMILSTLSAFGIMMSLATIFFKANWGGHHEALNKVIFIIVCSLCLVCSVSITIRIALRYKVPINVQLEERLSNFLEQCSTIMATLFIISSFTSIIGFIIGYIIKYQLLLDKIFGGGLHSGIIGLLSSLVFIAAIYGGPKSRFSLLSISMVVNILALISSAVSYYTEEIEIDHSINYITKNYLAFTPKFQYRKLLLMTKSTLILISSIFGLVFGTPLTVSICCLLKKDLILQPPKMHGNQKYCSNECDIEYIYGTCPNTQTNLIYKDPYGRNKLINSAMMGSHHLLAQPTHLPNTSHNMENAMLFATDTIQSRTMINDMMLRSPSLSTNRIPPVTRKEDVCDLLKEIGNNTTR